MGSTVRPALAMPSDPRRDLAKPEGPSRAVVTMILAAGVVMLSISSPLAIGAMNAGMEPLSVAFWRMLLAAILQAPLAIWEYRRSGGAGVAAAPRWPGRRGWLFALGAGVFLGVHFSGFIGALKHTSVASATTLATLTPLVTVAASWILLREKAPWAFWPSLGVAMLGAWLMTADQWGEGGSTRAGNLLALLGACCATGYYMCGKQARASFPLGLYATQAYAVAAATLLAISLAVGAPVAVPSAEGWFFCLMLALVPTLLGHSVANWSLKHVQPAYVSMMILAEPPLAMAMCWYFLGSEVSAAGVWGSAVTLLGLGFYLAQELVRQRSTRPAPPAVPLLDEFPDQPR